MTLQKVIWTALMGTCMVLSWIAGAWAKDITATVAQDHTAVAVQAEGIAQLHQDLEEIKELLRQKGK